MDKEEEFRSSLSLIDSLFSEVSFEDSRILCRSRRTELGSWRLCCTNGSNTLWENEYDFEAIVKHKRSLGLGDESFHTYFDRFRNAFQNDRIILECSHGGMNELALNAWCVFSENDQKEITYSYKLTKFVGDEFTEKNSRLMFEMLIHLKSSLQTIEEHNKSAEKMHKEPFEFSHSTNSPSKSVSDYEYFASTGKQSPKKSKNLKRKPGFSLLNPNVKRIVPKGAKIGEDCTPPNPSRTNPIISGVHD